MNPVFDYALKMSAYDTAIDMLAKSILTELGAESVTSFNDDDIYTYNSETMELQPGRGSHYQKPKTREHPLVEVRGMRARSLGLWQYKEQS